MKVDNGYVQAPVPEGIDLKEEILRLKKREERYHPRPLLHGG